MQRLATCLCSRLLQALPITVPPSASHPWLLDVSRKKGGKAFTWVSFPRPHFSRKRPSAERHEHVWTAAWGSSISRWKTIWVFGLSGEKSGTITTALAGSSVWSVEFLNTYFLSSGGCHTPDLCDSGLWAKARYYLGVKMNERWMGAWNWGWRSQTLTGLEGLNIVPSRAAHPASRLDLMWAHFQVPIKLYIQCCSPEKQVLL